MDTGAGPQGAGIESQLKLQDLNARYVEAIDEGRFEDWPDFFMENCKYRITTAENVEQGLPLSIIYATSRAMLRDRVKALREANVYEAQRYRHVLGPSRLADMDFAVVPNPATHLEGIVARIGHIAILDRQPVAIGRVAGALFGLNHHAPAAIEDAGVGRRTRGSKRRRRRDQQGKTVSEHCILTGKQHGPRTEPTCRAG